jgi:hypothetical protein
MDVGDILVEFRRTGGRAGNDEHLVVGRDGQATLRTPDNTSGWSLVRPRSSTSGSSWPRLDSPSCPRTCAAAQRRTNPSLMSSSTPSPPMATPSGRSAVRSRRSWCPWSRR